MNLKWKHIIAATVFLVGHTSFSQEVSRTVLDVRSPEVPTFFTIEVGPAFTTGLQSDDMMLNMAAALNHNYSANISGKLFGDIALATGADPARFMNFGLGFDLYPTERRIFNANPYISVDVGYSFTRSSEQEIVNAPAVGIGAGWRFASRWDINAHYTRLVEEEDGEQPSMLALRGGVNF